ncbi:flagellin [Ectothiorhodospira haloalkaliphila]|uniref:flagellin N-terminal helical domain-containing protein n=1 Tax=Ectothiorhodospira haloalkaliphila TaxID=421628 RepID=UPI002379BD10|nr:flagellin [Ectothiorhodospira haloalkaliphila]
MSQVINTNIASLNAQRNLNSSQSQLNVALERLSSGLRINSAKDDAAGLAIAERFTSQINGLDQGVRNANDGVSYAQTAEGALGEVANLMQRVRQLSVQSANATNSASDRAALNQEVQQAVEEINRIASTTQFNGQNILDGTLENLIFQVGANSGQTIVAGGIDSRGSVLGAVLDGTSELADTWVGAQVYDVDLGPIFAVTDDDTAKVTINGTEIELTLAATDSITDIVNGFNISGDLPSGVTALNDGDRLIFINDSGTEYDIDFAYTPVGATEPALSGLIQTFAGQRAIDLGPSFAVTDDDTAKVTINGTEIELTLAATDSITDIVNGFNISGDLPSGVTALNDGDRLIFINDSGTEYDIDFAYTPVGATEPALSFTGIIPSVTEDTLTLNQYLSASNTADFTVQINGANDEPISIDIEGARSFSDVISQINARATETGVSANLSPDGKEINFTSEFGQPFDVTIETDLGTPPITVNATEEDNTFRVDNFAVDTLENANNTLLAVDYALQQVSGFRAQLGAIQNRFDSNIANLQVGSENLSASRSRIQDADFAAETAALTRGQILQQAGTSVLAQANQLPQNVLQLLQ